MPLAGPFTKIRHEFWLTALPRSFARHGLSERSRAPARDTRSPHTRGRPTRWLWGCGLWERGQDVAGGVVVIGVGLSVVCRGVRIGVGHCAGCSVGAQLLNPTEQTVSVPVLGCVTLGPRHYCLHDLFYLVAGGLRGCLDAEVRAGVEHPERHQQTLTTEE